jgi:hypothetical protein
MNWNPSKGGGKGSGIREADSDDHRFPLGEIFEEP